MSIKPSYFDFLLHGVSFASNAYRCQQDKKPWRLEESHLEQIREVWSKNFWVSAGLSLSSTVAAFFCLSLTASPNLAKAASIVFSILSIFLAIRLIQASRQSFSWDKWSCDIGKRVDRLE
jgi:hypothetical protein